MLTGGRGPTDQQRQLESAALHLLRDADHLVERRRDQPREPDDVAVLLECSVEDAVGRDHDPEVEHLVPVAAEDDPHDALPDVVHVTLHGCEHDAGRRRALRLLVLHEGLEVGDGPLHRSRALHDLR